MKQNNSESDNVKNRVRDRIQKMRVRYNLAENLAQVRNISRIFEDKKLTFHVKYLANNFSARIFTSIFGFGTKNGNIKLHFC